MRKQALLIPVLLLATACEQVSQTLPFEVDPDTPISRSIGSSGGTISTPDGLAVTFPQGSLPGNTQISVRFLGTASAFPEGMEGKLIPESVFEILPQGLLLNTPARLGIRLSERTLTAAEALRVGFAVTGASDPILVEDISYDLTSGLVLGPLPALGVVGVRIAEDVIPMTEGDPQGLGGGNFGGGGSQPSSSQPEGGAQPVPAGAQLFSVDCGPDSDQPRCLESDGLRIWASLTVRDRFEGALVLVGPRVEGSVTFSGFEGGNPTQANGKFRVTGILRVKVGQSVASYEVDEVLSTGYGGAPSTTPVRVSGSNLVFQNTSEGVNEAFPYDIRPQGTGTRLIVQTVEEVELENEDGSLTIGEVTIHLRLRR